MHKIRFLSISAVATFVAACSLTVGPRSTTEATLRRIKKIVEYCDLDKKLKDRNLKCIEKYIASQSSPIDIRVFIMDSYGQAVILEKSNQCSDNTVLPYSRGPNHIDECGKGDDVTTI